MPITLPTDDTSGNWYPGDRNPATHVGSRPQSLNENDRRREEDLAIYYSRVNLLSLEPMTEAVNILSQVNLDKERANIIARQLRVDVQNAEDLFDQVIEQIDIY